MTSIDWKCNLRRVLSFDQRHKRQSRTRIPILQLQNTFVHSLLLTDLDVDRGDNTRRRVLRCCSTLRARGFQRHALSPIFNNF